MEPEKTRVDQCGITQLVLRGKNAGGRRLGRVSSGRFGRLRGTQLIVPYRYAVFLPVALKD